MRKHIFSCTIDSTTQRLNRKIYTDLQGGVHVCSATWLLVHVYWSFDFLFSSK